MENSDDKNSEAEGFHIGLGGSHPPRSAEFFIFFSASFNNCKLSIQKKDKSFQWGKVYQDLSYRSMVMISCPILLETEKRIIKG